MPPGNQQKSYVKHFNDITKHDVNIAGGKGASLGEMTQAGIPVPEGFVILSYAFEDFVKDAKLGAEIDTILEHVDINNMQTIENASEKIQAMIKGSKIPKIMIHQIMESYSRLNAKFVAVRSSATSEDSASAAWAGQLDSYLNTVEAKLLDNIRRCWASLYTPRAIFYCIEKGLHRQKNSVAVVVQKMVDSDVSGIAFSVHPVTQDRNQIIIEAGLGLGEAIVSGQVTPDSYIIHKKGLTMLEKNINVQNKKLIKVSTGGNEWVQIEGDKQKLSDVKVRELAEVIIRIENHYGFPCDIEWAVEKEKIYIVQSRPITTLTDIEEPKTDEKPKTEIAETQSAKTTEISSENKNRLITLSKRKQIIQQFPSDMFTLLSAAESIEVMKKHCGFAYPGFYFSCDNRNGTMCYFSDNNDLVWNNIAAQLKKDKLYLQKREKLYHKLYAKTMLKHQNNRRKYVKHPDLSNLSAMLISASELTAYGVGIGHLIEAINMTQTHRLKDLLAAKIKDPRELPNAINTLTLPEKISFVTNYNLMLVKACEIKDDTKKRYAIQKAIDKYFWIGNSYAGISRAKVEDILKNPPKRSELKIYSKQELKKQKEVIIKRYNLDKEIITLADMFSFLTTWQDERKENILKGVDECAYAIEECSRLTGISTDLLNMMTPDDVRSQKYLDKEFTESLKDRREYMFTIYDQGGNPLHTVFAGESAKKFIEPLFIKHISDESDMIAGACASTGKAVGKVYICKTLDDIQKFPDGYVLVASMTRPEFVPAMKKAVAIITDEGGITCHAAIVSRELGIPCIIGTRFATRVLQQETLVEVNANHGMVRILSNREDDAKDAKTSSSLTNIRSGLISRNKEIMKWGPVAGKYMNFFSEDLHAVYLSKDDRYPEVRYPHTLILFKGEQILWLNDYVEMEKSGEISFKKYLNNENRVKVKSYYESCKKKLIEAVKYAQNKDVYSMTLNEIAERLDRLSEAKRDIYGSSFIVELANYGIIRIFKEALNKKVPEKDILKVIEILTAPTSETIYQKEEYDLSETNDIKSHAKKYAWLQTGFSGSRVIQIDEFVNRKKILSKDIRQRNIARFKEINKQKDETIKKYALPKEILDWSILCSENIMWQDDRKAPIYHAIFMVYRLVNRLSEKIGIQVSDLENCSIQEIIEAIKKNSFEELKKIIARRKNSFGFDADYNKITELEEKQTEKYWDLNTTEDIQNVGEEITGTVANPSKKLIRGVVRIILNPHHTQVFNNGDIFVTSMTTPDYIFLMKKASAVITDTGGLTSHAAVTSRELGIPCIIGTKFATKALKDGDYVEVDADKGIVRKIDGSKNLDSLDGPIDFDPKMWHHLGKWAEPALAVEVWLEYGKVAQQYFKQKLDGKILYVNGDFFLSQHDVNIITQESYDAAKSKNMKFFDNMSSIIHDVVERMVRKTENIGSPKEYLEDIKELTGVWMPLNIVAIGVERYINEIDPKAFSFAKGLTQEKPWTLQEVDEMRKLKKKIGIPKDYESASSDVKKLLQEHAKKYEWLGSHHFLIHRFTVDELLTKMREDKEESIVQKSGNSYLIKLIDLMGFIRFKCAEVSAYCTYYLSKKLSEIAKKYYVTYEELVEHTIEEIFLGKVSKNTAEKRKLNTGFYYDGKIRVLSDEATKKAIEILLSKTDEKQELKGLIACKGYAKGIVKIVIGKKDMGKFNAGDILVAYETTPDVVTAMRKAAAIVTDFGGLTSHAAIVSREFKIPCIVGTKQATKILKDGDLVEVDANIGIVRQLNVKSDVDNKEYIPSYFKNLTKWATRPMTMQRDEFGGVMWWDLCKGRFVSAPGDKNNRALYIERDDMDRGYELFAKEMSSVSGWKEHQRKYYASIKAMETATSEVKNIDKYSLKDLGKVYRMWMHAYELFGRFNIAPFSIEKVLDPRCRELLKNELGSGWESVFAIISTPSQLNDYQKMRLRMLDIVINNMSKDTKSIQKLVNDYYWYSEYSYIEPLLDDKYFRDELAKISVQQAREEKKKIMPDIDKSAKDFVAVMKRLKNPQVRLLAEVLHNYTFLRTDRIDNLKKNQAKMRPLYDRLAVEFTKASSTKWTREMVACCLNSELLDFMEKGVIPKSDEIAQRMTHQYVYYYENGKPHIIHDPDTIKKVLEIIEHKVHVNNEISGMIAYKGKARGVVSIVNGKYDLYKVKKGDILVARTTMPDYLPAMKISAAFVTEEGGITSHAAIVARELKTPCIVGTGNCMELLKDGDLVEVDADKGIVRKIQKENPEQSPTDKVSIVKKKNPSWEIIGNDFNSFFMRNQIWVEGANLTGKVIPILKSFNKTLAIRGMSGKIDYLANLDLWQEMHNILTRELDKDINLLDRIITETNKFGDESIALARSLCKDPSEKKSNLQLFEESRELARRQKMLYAYGVPLPLVDLGDQIYIQTKLRQALERMLPPSKVQDALKTLTQPIEDSFSIEAEKELLKLCVEITNDKSLKQIFAGTDASKISHNLEQKNRTFYSKLMAYTEKYTWVYYGFNGPAAKPLDYINSMIELIRSGPDKKILELKAQHETLVKEKDNLIKNYAKDDFTKRLFNLAGTFVWAKPRRKDYQSCLYYYMIEYYMTEISKRLKVTRQEILSLPFNDIEDALIRNKKIDAIKAKKIFEGHVLIPKDDGIKSFYDKELSEINDQITIPQQKLDFTGELKGTAAYTGKVSGKVSIINTPQEMDKLNVGDILVSVATTPSIVPAMRKAAAFITDEGGLTCHASIIARELKKPCIVGTKFATQVFKDGDYVEVDADNGFVKIIDAKDRDSKDSEFDTLLKYVKNTKMDIQKARAAICSPDIVFPLYVNRERIIGTMFPAEYVYIKDGNYTQVTPQEYIDNVAKNVFKYSVEHPKEFSKILSEDKIHAIKIDKYWEKRVLNKPIDRKTFDEFTKILSEWWIYAFLGEEKGTYFGEEILSNLQKNYGMSKSEATQFMNNVCHPDVPSALGMERFEFFNLCVYVLEDKGLLNKILQSDFASLKRYDDFTSKISIYLKKYFYKDSNFMDRKILRTEDIIKEIHDEIKNNSPDTIKRSRDDMSKELKGNTQEKNALMQKMKLNPSDKRLILAARQMATFIDDRKTTMMKSFYYFFSMMHSICDSHGWNLEDIQYLQIKEISRSLEGKILDMEEISRRRKGVFLIYKTGEDLKMVYNPQADILMESVNSVQQSEEIHGNVASLGRIGKLIEGKVHIINDPAKEEFFDGEILVTSMTRIEYVPLMRKAKAIITDEGGMACHAAIVSREMGVPCIIGTKNATKLLKSGDNIVMDMEHGTVKKVRNPDGDKSDDKKNDSSNDKTQVKYFIPRKRQILPVPCIWLGIVQTYDDAKKFHGTNLNTEYQCFENGYLHIITIADEWNSSGEFIAQRMLNENDYLFGIYNLQLKLGSDMIKYSQYIIEQDLEKLEVKDLMHIEEKLKELWFKFDTVNVPPWFFAGDPFQKHIKEKIKAVAPNLSDEEFTTLVTCPELSFSSEEELRILKLSKEIKEKKINLDNLKKLPDNIIKKINDLVKTYYWIPFGYDGPDKYDYSHYFKILHDDSRDIKSIKMRIQALENYEKSLIGNQNRIIKRYSISAYIVSLLKKAYMLHKMTDQRKECQYQNFIALHKVFDSLSKKLGIPGYVCKYMTLDEIKSYSRIDLLKTADKRKNELFFIEFNKGKVRYIYDNEAKDLYSQILSEDKNQDVIKGYVANSISKEKTVGRVKILISPKDLKKLVKGDILVSHMTTPEYVPGMRISAGIITDEGGITSHAAIVSRELNVPCIIGTKNATQVLKDGDLVEMDTINGTVKKIESAKSQNSSHQSSDNNSITTHPLLKKFFDAVKDDKLMKFRGDYYPLLIWVDWMQHFDNSQKQSNIYPALMTMKDNHMVAYISDDKYIHVTRSTLSDYMDSRFDMKIRTKEYRKSCERIDSAYNEFYNKIYSEKELMSRIRTCLQTIEYFVGLTLFTERLDKDVTSRVIKEMKLDVDIEKVWKLVSLKDFKSLEVKNKEMLLNTKNMMDAKDASDLLYLQYIWADYGHVPESEEIRARVNKINIKDLKDSITKSLKEIKEGQDTVSKQIKSLNIAEKSIYDYLHWIMYLRDDRKEYLTKIQVLLFNLVSRLYRTWDIDQKYVGMSIVHEVLKGKEYIKSRLNHIELRMKNSVVLEWNGLVFDEDIVLPDKVTEVLEEHMLRQNQSEDKEIRGEIGCKGLTRGFVRKIYGKNEFQKFIDGEILVTGMTRPEFVTLMKKASGIITDEGGITSHAAIVSRELNKPCIIGTKIATQVLKDGDYVEVDANAGIVRILDKDTKTSTLSEIIPSKWEKYWQANISYLMCSLLGQTYTQYIPSNGTKGFSKAYIFTHNGNSTCYFKLDDRKGYADYVIQKYALDKKGINSLALLIKNKADGLLSYIHSIKNQMSRQQYVTFKHLFLEYNSYHIMPRHIADFLDDKIDHNAKAQFMEILKGARVYVEKLHSEIDAFLADQILKILEDKKYTRDMVMLSTDMEIEDYFKTKKFPSTKELLSRKDASGFIFTKDDIVKLDNKETAAAENIFIITSSVSNIKGNTAYGGKSKGIVRIVHDPTKYARFDDGDILITGMTRPEFMPLMKKASAVVTDAGGLLCHAAIISRELKKPCIIGTKIASQVLKDGDYVEVDATKGIVTILKKTN